MPRLNLKPHDLLKSGYVNYSLHSDGRIEYHAKIKVRWGWFSKTVERSGTYHAGPEALLSSSYDQVKEVTAVANAKCQVSEIRGNLSYVKVESPDVAGDVILDISNKITSVVRVNLHTKVMNRSIKIEAS